MDFREIRRRSENHRCADCDVGDDMLAEIERLRKAVDLAYLAYAEGRLHDCFIALTEAKYGNEQANQEGDKC